MGTIVFLVIGAILLQRYFGSAEFGSNQRERGLVPGGTVAVQVSSPSPSPVPVPRSARPSPSTSPLLKFPTVESSRLARHIQGLNFVRYTPEARRTAREYIIQTLKTAGWQPKLQPFDSGVNVVAERLGTDPKAGAIVLGAHYDTVNRSPGADDNATGVAVVLEAARLLGSRPTPRTLRLALFDREEAGLFGSLAYTADRTTMSGLQGAVIMDMVGFACRTDGCQRYPEGLPVKPPSSLGDFLAVAGDQEHLPLLNAFTQAAQPSLPPVLTLPVPFKGALSPDLLRSDHAPFWYRGIGAVIATDTANFRTPYYHQPGDRPSTLDLKFFTGSAQVIINATTRLLEGRTSLATAPN